MSPDDFKGASDGSLDFAERYLEAADRRCEGLCVGDEQDAVFTDAQGNFTLNAPAGDVKIVIDGTTATTRPTGYYFPTMTMDMTVRPGIANTLMGGMGSLAEQSADAADPAVYLPRVANDILTANPAANARAIASAEDSGLPALDSAPTSAASAPQEPEEPAGGPVNQVTAQPKTSEITAPQPQSEPQTVSAGLEDHSATTADPLDLPRRAPPPPPPPSDAGCP